MAIQLEKMNENFTQEIQKILEERGYFILRNQQYHSALDNIDIGEIDIKLKKLEGYENRINKIPSLISEFNMIYSGAHEKNSNKNIKGKNYSNLNSLLRDYKKTWKNNPDYIILSGKREIQEGLLQKIDIKIGDLPDLRESFLNKLAKLKFLNKK